jgi:protoporphyrinogen oxidase
VSRSRRALLAGLLASGSVACATRRFGKVIAGSIVGGAHRLGHRLRGELLPQPVRRVEIPVVIVGAGIAGLTAAWRLDRAGSRDFLVLELEDAPGGTARSGEGPVSAFPWGAHYVTAPDPTFRPLVALLEEVGAVAGRDARGRPIYAEEALCRDPQERIFFRGEWLEGLFPRVAATPEDLAQLGAFETEMRRWAGWRDERGRRAFAAPRAGSSDTEELRGLDRISMAEYLATKSWNAPRLRWFVEYACRDDFGTTLETTSAWAGIHYFAARLDAPSGEAAEFITWPEGNGRLVGHLARLAGPRLRTGALVTNVKPRGGRVDVLYLDARTGEATEVRAENVILAIPQFLVGRVLEPLRRTPSPTSESRSYAPWLVANLTLRDRPSGRGFPLAWDNVLYDSSSLGYVVATHQTGRDYGPTVLTYYEAFADADARRARQQALAKTWEEWTTRILSDLGRAHPGIHDLVDRLDVYLWGHAMPQPRPGQLWGRARHADPRRFEGIHLAHTDLSGMALVEEAVYWGVAAAEDVLARHDRNTAEGLQGHVS